MAASYQHDYRAFGEHVLNAEWMRLNMLGRAERGEALAVAIAPFDARDSDGKHYKDDFHVASGTHGGIHKDRAYAILSNSNSAAWIVEFGFGPGVDKNGRPFAGQPGHSTLRKAMEVMR